jgi:NAD(P)-dependent dehydrogenase (short-subunit alcohol dehydrogenase family)
VGRSTAHTAAPNPSLPFRRPLPPPRVALLAMHGTSAQAARTATTLLARRSPRHAAACAFSRANSRGMAPCARARPASTAAGAAERRCVVVGGCGALGAAMVQRFAGSPGWHCTSVDFHESDAADANVLLQPHEPLTAKAELLLQALGDEDDGVDVIIHAAGGWAGSDPGSGAFPASLESLWSVNVESAALAAHAAGALLRPRGMLVLTGAHAAAIPGGTAGMTAYGMTKAATHHLMESFAATATDGRRATAILPVTIDSASNREAMPDADTSTWTDPSDVADELLRWANVDVEAAVEGQHAPENGSCVSVLTEGGETRFVYQRGAPVNSGGPGAGIPGGHGWRQSVKAEKGFEPPVFHHVNVVSRDVGEMHEFYRDVVMMDRSENVGFSAMPFCD